jgi:hypothetical protein
MHTRPSILYSGMTVVLDAPSRFDEDTGHLLSGPAGPWFSEISGLAIDSLDIRTVDTPEAWLPGTERIVLAGSKATHRWTRQSNDPPCYTSVVPPGIHAMPVFPIQDCCDFKNLSGDDTEHEESFTERESKDRIPTRRKNYRFWTQVGVRKLLSPPTAPEPALKGIYYPKLNEVIQLLLDTRNEDLYLDIESSRSERCLTVVGFSTTKTWPKIYVVPVYLYNGDLAYQHFHRFHLALSVAMSRNTVVGHNIAGFDLLVLALFYGFPIPALDPYDTMLANHRCFPEAEKSLAHVIAQWTNQPYHKDFSTEVYNFEQQNKLWVYNAHDVYTLKLIKDAQLAYASTIPGLTASINQANTSIVPYLVTSMTGLGLDEYKLASIGKELRRTKDAMARVASVLVGRPFNPGSSQQCIKFFVEELGYPVVGRTAEGKPAMGRKALYQMMLKHSNPLLPVIVKYRSVAKDLAMLESELL